MAIQAALRTPERHGEAEWSMKWSVERTPHCGLPLQPLCDRH
jgi:hypothetical protein